MATVEISTQIKVISSCKTICFGGRHMKQVICPICGSVCIKYGKNKSGTQRWFCKRCKSICTPKIDNSSKQLNIFLKWLFSKQTQREMPGEGRTFRRKTSMFWDIWPMPPIVESKRDVHFMPFVRLDGTQQQNQRLLQDLNFTI